MLPLLGALLTTVQMLKKAIEETEAADESEESVEDPAERKRNRRCSCRRSGSEQMKQLLKRLQLRIQAQRIARFVVTQTLKEQSPANPVVLHSITRVFPAWPSMV